MQKLLIMLVLLAVGTLTGNTTWADTNCCSNRTSCTSYAPSCTDASVCTQCDGEYIATTTSNAVVQVQTSRQVTLYCSNNYVYPSGGCDVISYYYRCADGYCGASTNYGTNLSNAISSCTPLPSGGRAYCIAGQSKWQCSGNYYYNGSSCVACPTNAICTQGAHTTSDTTPDTWTCKSGYFKNSAGTACTACPSNANCDTGKIICNSGYYLNGTSCTACPKADNATYNLYKIGGTTLATPQSSNATASSGCYIPAGNYVNSFGDSITLTGTCNY